MLSHIALSRGTAGLIPHLGQRSLCLQVPLFSDHKVTRALNPWDEKIELEGTNKAMHWPSYNERFVRGSERGF